AADFAAGLGRVRALPVVGVDRDDHFLHGLKAPVALEGREVGEILFAARLSVGTENGEFHWLVSLFLRGRSGGGFGGRSGGLRGRRALLGFSDRRRWRRQRPLALDRGADDYIVAVRAGNRALHEDEILVGDDLHD